MTEFRKKEVKLEFLDAKGKERKKKEVSRKRTYKFSGLTNMLGWIPVDNQADSIEDQI